MGYTSRAFKGFSWIGGIRVISRGLTLVETAVTGRILSPAQFGIFGIGLLVLSLIEIITETGINIFLVQQKDSIDSYIDTAWIVSMIRGVVIGAVIIVSSPFIASFFHSPGSTSMLLLISFVPIIRGFINPAEISFQKNLNFHKEFYFRSALFFIETVFTLFFILVTKSVYSLVLGMIVSAIAEVVISFTIIKPRPHFIFHKEKFQKVIHFGKWITASTVLNYFYQNGDNMSVGRMLGTTQLGFYDMAYRISLVPITDIADVIKTVSFPVFVKIADDRDRLKRAFFKSLLGMLALVIPACAILYFFPYFITHIILGDKWLTIIPVLRILAIFGVVRSISAFSSALFLAVGRQQVSTYINLIGLLGLGISIVPFIIHWGIVGAGYSALLGTSLTIPVIIYYSYILFSEKPSVLSEMR